MRFAIWTAVSTPSQAKGWDKSPQEKNDLFDKVSLPEQERKCRAAGTTKGWIETRSPYIVPGESRTRWTNLRDAEAEIPALHAMLEDAKTGKFDILIMYDYNRLRDLLDQVAKTLSYYHVQIYSVNQPVEPLAPDAFSPYASDSESMMRGMSQIISRWQISDLRRKYFDGVPGRVRAGITSLRIPYGYIKPPGRELDKKVIPIQVDNHARIIAEIKDQFLSGKSYYDIRDELNARGIPSPQGGALGWNHTTIKKLLVNPFYAGKVFFGRTQTIRDPHLNTVRLVKNPNPLIRPGKHKAIFTEEEHQAILIEVKRREGLPHRNRYHFAGLLVCSICGAHLVHDHGVWRCKPRDVPIKDHIGLRVEEAFALIPRELQKALRTQTPGETSFDMTWTKDPEAELKELERQRQLIQRRLESEIYTDDEAERKIKALNAQKREVQNEEGHEARRRAQRQQFLKSFEQAQAILHYLPEWIKEEESRTVNQLLLRLCSQITVTPELIFTIHFRR